jgi:hypothetical protein
MSENTDLPRNVDIDIDLLFVSVNLKSKTGIKKYSIREMPAPVFFEYIEENKELASMDIDEGGKAKISMLDSDKIGLMGNAIPMLLKRCLFDENDQPVTEEFINSLTLRVQHQLMGIAQEVNGMTGKAAEQAGNSQTGNESGTDLLPGSTVPLPSAKEKQELDGS